jgi:hypothetical protein
MEIEQTLPKKPNFLLILALFCVTILIVFVLALLFLDVEGGHIHLRHRDRHPTSQLALPASGGAYFAAGESEA